MKTLVKLFLIVILVASALAVPVAKPILGFGGGFSESSAFAGSQSFGGGYGGFPGFGGGFGGSSAYAGAQSASFGGGFGR